MKYLKFRYVNHNGEDHEYVIEPDGGLGFGNYTIEDKETWHLSGNVVTRDEDPRPEMGDNRRRSFVITRMRDIEEVAA